MSALIIEKVKMINRKDIFLAISIHRREHVSGHSQISDVGVANVSGLRVTDSSEKKMAPQGKKKAYAQITDLCDELRAAVTIDMGDDDLGQKGKKGKKGKDAGVLKHRI